MECTGVQRENWPILTVEDDDEEDTNLPFIRIRPLKDLVRNPALFCPEKVQEELDRQVEEFYQSIRSVSDDEFQGEQDQDEENESSPPTSTHLNGAHGDDDEKFVEDVTKTVQEYFSKKGPESPEDIDKPYDEEFGSWRHDSMESMDFGLVPDNTSQDLFTADQLVPYEDSNDADVASVNETPPKTPETSDPCERTNDEASLSELISLAKLSCLESIEVKGANLEPLQPVVDANNSVQSASHSISSCPESAQVDGANLEPVQPVAEANSVESASNTFFSYREIAQRELAKELEASQPVAATSSVPTAKNSVFGKNKKVPRAGPQSWKVRLMKIILREEAAAAEAKKLKEQIKAEKQAAKFKREQIKAEKQAAKCKKLKEQMKTEKQAAKCKKLVKKPKTKKVEDALKGPKVQTKVDKERKTQAKNVRRNPVDPDKSSPPLKKLKKCPEVTAENPGSESQSTSASANQRLRNESSAESDVTVAITRKKVLKVQKCPEVIVQNEDSESKLTPAPTEESFGESDVPLAKHPKKNVKVKKHPEVTAENEESESKITPEAAEESFGESDVPLAKRQRTNLKVKKSPEVRAKNGECESKITPEAAEESLGESDVPRAKRRKQNFKVKEWPEVTFQIEESETRITPAPTEESLDELDIPLAILREKLLKAKKESTLTSHNDEELEPVDDCSDSFEKPELHRSNKYWSQKIQADAVAMWEAMQKPERDLNRLKKLMKRTFQYRRHEYDNAEDVDLILQNFPALTDYRLLKYDMKLLRNLDLKALDAQWSSQLARTYQACADDDFSKSDPVICSALEELKNQSSNSELLRDIQLLCVGYQETNGKLYKNLYAQRLKKNQEPFKSPANTPSIDILGTLGCPNTQISIYCESTLITKTPSFYEAVMTAYSLYWLLNLKYESHCMKFFELLDSWVQ